MFVVHTSFSIRNSGGMRVNLIQNFVEFVFGKNGLDDAFEENEEKALVESLVLEKLEQTKDSCKMKAKMIFMKSS